MKRLIATLLTTMLLTGCATQAPKPGAVISQDRFAQLVIPGQTTRAELLAAFGPTETVRFDSGFETWLYETGPRNTPHTELVLLLDKDGIVRKTRMRPPLPTDVTLSSH
jgi:outer membrane protein assembly factor BamE (lipoprotein component of BamABCDE complex)